MMGVIESFIVLFVIMDPVGNLPIFMGLTKGMPVKEIKKNVDRSIFVAGVLLFVFLFLGPEIFDFFGIDITSFQIAGGVILLILGITYVFGLSTKFVKSHGSIDLSVPVGTPLLTGPGAIMTTIILVEENGATITVAAAFLALLATWFILMNSAKIYRILGEHWTNVISRIMGIILASIAVEFIIEGIISIAAAS